MGKKNPLGRATPLSIWLGAEGMRSDPRVRFASPLPRATAPQSPQPQRSPLRGPRTTARADDESYQPTAFQRRWPTPSFPGGLEAAKKTLVHDTNICVCPRCAGRWGCSDDHTRLRRQTPALSIGPAIPAPLGPHRPEPGGGRS